MNDLFLFTSESVTEGHPDKLCDLISDSILDAYIAKDPNASVACEVIAKTGFVMLIGEISSSSNVDLRVVTRETIARVGYLSSKQYFDARLCHVGVLVGTQSPDIKKSLEIAGGAGDQGIFFGYATDENPERMPTTLLFAHRLAERLTYVRKEGIIKGLGPDGKTQVSIEYRNDNGAVIPVRVHTVVVSTMHEENVDLDELREQILENVIKVVIPRQYLDDDTIMMINPGGRFVIGGPAGDAGLTGRKVIIDSYGGWGSCGGGALSGKDPTKIDRTASYAARWVAKSIVDSGLARRCLVQLSYGFSLEHPLSVYVDTYGTGTISNSSLVELINSKFDLRPREIVRTLDLMRPIYHKTAVYGHFGRNDPDFTWESSIVL